MLPATSGAEAQRQAAEAVAAGTGAAVAVGGRGPRGAAGGRRDDDAAGRRPRGLTLALDGEKRTLPVTLVAVGNTSRYGGGMKVCPGADPTDGLSDVTVAGPLTRRALVRQQPRLTAGTHVDSPAVTVHRAARVEVCSPGATTYADGQPVAPLPAVAECVPGALCVGTGRG